MRKLASLVFALLAISASAFSQMLIAPLTGAAEGIGDPEGSGLAVITISGTTVNYTILAEGIGTVTVGHIHEGGAGVMGNPIVDLQPAFSAGVSTGSVQGVAQQVIDGILANPAGFYVNVHTTEFPNGAIRGQLALGSAPGALGATQLFLPNTSKVAGANNTNFVTDLRILNRGNAAANVTLDFFGTSSAGLTAPTATRTIVVGPGEQEVLDDVLAATLSVSGLGALRVSADRPVEVRSRVINDLRSAGLGTLGSAVQGLTLPQAQIAGTLSFLSRASDADRAAGVGFRTNIGFFNPSPTSATVTFTARRTSDGAALGTNTVSVPGFSHQQPAAFALLSNVPAANQVQADFYVTYTSTAPLFVFAAVIDNKSGDSVIIQ